MTSSTVMLMLSRAIQRAAPAWIAIPAGAALWMARLNINMTVEDVMWTNLIHGFGFGLAYTPMATLAFSTLAGPLLTQGNAVFSLVRMLGSSLFIAVILVVFVQSTAIAHANLASSVALAAGDLLQPWIDQFGPVDSVAFQAFASAQVSRQATMIGYINAFHLLTLLPALAIPLAFFFRIPRKGQASIE
ncbi:MAG: hypothetical protein HOI95_22465 [Chromatiales bacterium]|nr:hypothetical protein [Chromatiales bacterium]